MNIDNTSGSDSLQCGYFAHAGLQAVPYTATIHTPTGDVQDEGVASVGIIKRPVAAEGSENFTSTVDLALYLASAKHSDTVNATSPAGAIVNYQLPTVTDTDATLAGAPLPTVSCTPGDGTTFPIGTTTVTCEVTDSDDANSPVHTTITVHVKGAAEQLSDLYTEVQGVGPGTSLADVVAEAQKSVAAGNKPASCGILSAFVHEVQAVAGKSISADIAQVVVVPDATRIEAVLGCG